MKDVRIIKGAPGGPEGKWEQVQAIQHEPFIYIQFNGSNWAGQEEDEVAELLKVLSKYRLGEFWRDCPYAVNPCRGIDNPNRKSWEPSTPDNPHFIDGPRLYECDGVVRFHGNFERLSHAFCVDTNHKPTIEALMAAIEANASLAA